MVSHDLHWISINTVFNSGGVRYWSHKSEIYHHTANKISLIATKFTDRCTGFPLGRVNEASGNFWNLTLNGCNVGYFVNNTK